MNQPLITIQIVSWNSATALAKLLPLLSVIPQDEAAVTLIDNGSTDDSISLFRAALPNGTVIRLSENTGFCGGHNIGFMTTTTEFVLILNPDVALNWDNVKGLVKAFADPAVASVQGKLLRKTGDPTIIDSAGIVSTLSLNGKDRGAGKQDNKTFDSPAKLLATTGACSLYRVSALKKVAYGTYAVAGNQALEVFDKVFFAYKEDVDLGWRLQRAGFKNMYLPVVCGIHERALRSEGVGGWGLSPATIAKRLKSPRTRLSLQNYVYMIVKNATVRQQLIHGIFIESRLLVFIILSIFYWPLSAVWFDISRQMPHMMNKRYETSNHHG